MNLFKDLSICFIPYLTIKKWKKKEILECSSWLPGAFWYDDPVYHLKAKTALVKHELVN